MKFAAVVLLACVAVSSAAFTGSLVAHTKPALDKAMFSLRLAAGNKAVAIPAIDSILSHIQNTVAGLIQQAQDVLAHGQQLSQQLQQHLVDAVQALQAVGGQAASQLQQVIQNLLNNVGGVLGGNRAFDLASIVSSAQDALQQAVQLAQQLIAQIDLPALAIQAINAVLPQNVAQLVIAQLGLSTKGLFGDLFGNLWEQLTGAAGQVAQQISQIVSQITSIGQSAFAEVQAQASQFLANVSSGAQVLSAQAAEQILSHIGDLQEALGSQYQAVVDALNGIVVNGN